MKNIAIKSLREKQKDGLKLAEMFFKRPQNPADSAEDKPYEPKRLKRFIGLFVSLLLVFIIGGIGGVTIDRFALPYLLINYPQLNQYEFLKRLNERTTVVEVVKEVKISQDETMTEVIRKDMPSVVKIAPISDQSNPPAFGGTGVVLTSDGLILTAIKNVTPLEQTAENGKATPSTLKIKLQGGKIHDASIMAKDASLGLAILKISENNLPVTAFGNSDELELGEKVITLGDSVTADIVSKFVDDYISPEELRSSQQAGTVPKKTMRIKITTNQDESFYGAPVINVKGEIVGISQSSNLFIPINDVIKFINTAMNK